ncbi:endonuclease-reverse transcriptase HmRTE-e01 [Elysia marginata]|uniref:Endonuclease-reverse transcriptase HmRTE-e01 n=1 Tax=Elysia marginata TaxID=1093978 RepID=A0AAV4IUQ3_9GAST|nr:endonuclease-reverse transcriptase HmRTE-e01 [Elysia marginata]
MGGEGGVSTLCHRVSRHTHSVTFGVLTPLSSQLMYGSQKLSAHDSSHPLVTLLGGGAKLYEQQTTALGGRRRRVQKNSRWGGLRKKECRRAESPRKPEGLDMAVVNTFFKKREKQKITYKSGQGQSKIDFIMTRREDLKMFSDCKVIAGKEVVHQHRLVCGVVKVKECKKKRTRAEKRIQTWKLTGDVEGEFKDKVNRQHRTHKEQTANEKWIDLKGVLLITAEEVCGTSKGGKKIDKETWWWSEEVQTSIKKKKEAFKNWQREGTDQLKEVHK